MTSAKPLTADQLSKAAKAFHTKKRLGQHFLVDPDSLSLIAQRLAIQPGDVVVEVGCGTGFLTRLLSSYGAEVIAVDLDRESVAEVAALRLPRVRVVHGDFLNFDLCKLNLRRHLAEQPATCPPVSLKIAGNVPYQITGLIIGHLLGEIGAPAPWLPSIQRIVLTVQHEVALRMVASPGSKNYSQLSLLMQYFCRPLIESVLPPQKFFPPPQVTSAVVSLDPFRHPPVECDDHLLLRRVIHCGFKKRRKMLRNALAALALPGLDLNQLFSDLKLDPQARAEDLSLEKFASVTNYIKSRI